jgi:hypothetical protein
MDQKTFIEDYLSKYSSGLIEKLYEDKDWIEGINLTIPQASLENISFTDLLLQYLEISKEKWNIDYRIIKL